MGAVVIREASGQDSGPGSTLQCQMLNDCVPVTETLSLPPCRMGVTTFNVTTVEDNTEPWSAAPCG